jgi:NAD(P)-dependent dehydrogenase (short-subunit alcohol dehydrogenase family)
MRKSVLITGASTGIGEAIALRMDRLGWRVLAGVRQASDGERLRAAASDRLQWVHLDVTDSAGIAAAMAQASIWLGDAPLDGLVNNAGIVVGGPLEYLPLDDFRRQFEVNVVGLLAVTQAALPLLRRGRGRIVNIGSIGGRVTSPMVGPYCASKFAVEAISDAFRLELAEWGIYTSVIEPGVVVTPIWDKGVRDLDSAAAGLPAEALARYGGFLKAMRRIIAGAPRRGVTVDKVADATEHALVSGRPRHRYVIGIDARARLAAQTILPRRWMDAIVLSVLRKAAG